MTKWDHLSGFHVSFLSYGPEIVRNCVRFAIVCWCKQKSKSVKAIYVYASESSRFVLLESGIWLLCYGLILAF